jgi:hypothetical protein
MAEFVHAAALDENFLSVVSDDISSKGRKRRAIRIPQSAADYLEELHDMCGASKGGVVDFLLCRDLNAASEMITLSREALPIDIKERWIELLHNVLRVGPGQEDEEPL